MAIFGPILILSVSISTFSTLGNWFLANPDQWNHYLSLYKHNHNEPSFRPIWGTILTQNWPILHGFWCFRCLFPHFRPCWFQFWPYQVKKTQRLARKGTPLCPSSTKKVILKNTVMVATALIFVTHLGTFYRSRGFQKIWFPRWAETGVWKLPPEHCGQPPVIAIIALDLNCGP